MNIDRGVLMAAGGMLLVSLALAWLVGANLFQAAFTGFCPAAIMFRKLGMKEGPAFATTPAKVSR